MNDKTINNAFPGKGEISWDMWASLVTNKLNDYLSDKEASKGECDCAVCEAYRTMLRLSTERGGEPIYDESDRCPVCNKQPDEANGKCEMCGDRVIDPPQQEESRGECGLVGCDKCGGLPFKHKEWCGKPQLKEEPPKEDEMEVVFRNELAYKDEQGNYWVEENGWESVWEDIKPILKANFFSKVKIKNQLSQVEKLFKSVGLVSSLTVRNIIKEVIKGLEELC